MYTIMVFKDFQNGSKSAFKAISPSYATLAVARSDFISLRIAMLTILTVMCHIYVRITYHTEAFVMMSFEPDFRS
jgi:hypothetical protein